MSDLSSVAFFTPQEWKRILKGQPFRVLVTEEKEQWAGEHAVRCVSCAHARPSDSMPWHAWCLAHRLEVSDAFPKLCPRYEKPQ